MAKIAAIIQARTGSSRLPGKVLMDISGKSLLWHIIQRLKSCKKIDLIIVATSDKEADKPLIDLAAECRVESFAGSEDDVLDRFYQAAKKFNIDAAIRITGDCPLIHPETVDRMVSLFSEKRIDYVCGNPAFCSVEQGSELISMRALEKIKKSAKNDYQKEHLTIFIQENPQLFKIEMIDPEPIFARQDINLAVDTFDDFKLIKEIYKKLYVEGKIVDLTKVIKMLDDNPQIKKINENVKASEINRYAGKLRKEIAAKSLSEERNARQKLKIVFRCDASPEIGWGHLRRGLAIADKLKRSQIFFASIKDKTNLIIKERGFGLFLKDCQEEETDFLNRIRSGIKPDVLVIDNLISYLEPDIERLKADKIKVMMIDKLCPGVIAADEIIFPNIHMDKNLLKIYLSPKQINKVKTGPKYVIIRDEILKLKKLFKPVFKKNPDIVISTGSSDPCGVLLKLVLWLKEMNIGSKIVVLVGGSFKFQKELEKIKKNLPQNFQFFAYSAKKIVKANIAICTFGVSIYEMVYLGIPTICVSHSEENASVAKILAKNCGVIENAGYINDVNIMVLNDKIRLLAQKEHYLNLINKCDKLIDGKGARRIAELIEL